MNKQFFRIWHRRIGIFSLLMVLWLALSGSLINHGDFFEFNKKNINLPWLNALYGLDKAVEVPQTLLLSGNYYFCHEGSLYQNERVISACDSYLIAGVSDASSEQVFLLTEQELLSLDARGMLYDSISFSLLGHHLLNIILLIHKT